MIADSLARGQLALDLRLWHAQNFDTFDEAADQTAVAALKRLQEYPLIFLWGHSGTGKTHLLHAVFEAIKNQGKHCLYLDLSKSKDQIQDVLDDQVLELGIECLCLDNIHCVSGCPEQERCLFIAVNRMLESNKPLVVTSNKAPQKSGFILQDLISRFCLGPAFYLQGLGEEAKRRLLLNSAKRRGVELPEESLEFLLRRATRDLKTLMQTLDQLDAASLVAQRRLSIPFLKVVLGL